jgi:hypothetical protein
MSERVSLDTTGTMLPPTDADGPTQARFIIGQGQIVIAQSTEEVIRIDLGHIFDITVGPPPSDLTSAFDEILTIAFTKAGARETVMLEPRRVSSEKFAHTIVGEVLSGKDVRVRHSIQQSDANEHPDTTNGKLTLSGEGLQIDTAEAKVSISFDSIIKYQKSCKTIQKTTWPTVEVCHEHRDELQATELAMHQASDQQLLGRYIESKTCRK